MIRHVLLGIFAWAAVMGVVMSPISAQAYLFSNPLLDKPAKNFTLYTLTSEKTTLHDVLQSKKTIVFFWATWCPFCHQMIQFFSDQSAMLIEQDIKVIMVNVGEDKTTVQRFMEKTALKDVPVFLDTDGAVSQVYLVDVLPKLVFINEQGVVVDISSDLPNDLKQIF